MTTNPPEASKTRILKATAIAASVATLVLVVAVLPAEYGIDPLGTGGALGLTALSGTSATESVAAGARGQGSVEAGVGADAPGAPDAYAEDVYEVELRPFEGVEYKYRIETGGSLVYSWAATDRVGYEFHGEPDGAPAKYFDSYGKGEASEAHGGFTAPTPGIHGWFWENLGPTRVTVTLRTAGFYSASTEYRDGERVERRFEGR